MTSHGDMRWRYKPTDKVLNHKMNQLYFPKLITLDLLRTVQWYASLFYFFYFVSQSDDPLQVYNTANRQERCSWGFEPKPVWRLNFAS